MHRTLRTLTLVTLGVLLLSASPALSQSSASGQKWVTSWTGSVHGPYPLGFPSLPPDMKFAIPDPAKGAEDQTFRLIVKPDLWGSRMRLRFSNVHGTKPLVLDGVYLGVQASAGNLVRGTNRPVNFDGGKKQLTVAPGTLAWSDPVDLPYAKDPASPTLAGRKLAVSFHVVGTSGPMTWHAKAIQTSYVSAPKAGALGGDNSDVAFPYTTASWFFLDAIDVMAPADTAVIVCFGDSITDGTGTTMNGDDRYPDALSRRMHDAYGTRVSVVNAGIGGNRVVGPADYDKNPIPGGPGSLDRLDRDVLQLSGVTAVIWMEGINDFGAADTSAEAVIEGYKQGVARMHAKGIKVIGGTLTSALNSTIESHGRPVVDQKRQDANRFIREGKLFDAVADFDAATIDAKTGGILPEFQPNSTAGGPGDKLHPNRAGYAAMANAVDITALSLKAAAKKTVAKP
jgi:lysophospholipase L1-like esterase